ncbi:MAG: TraB/GumN family protein [Stenotrophomonas sp.]|uniref:TraB/GumN family protein n=1 Tax=Stenotrophomonas sp. TaxID=69392 RepID=UPI003D6CC879
MLKPATTISLFAVLGITVSAIANAQDLPQSAPKTLDTVVVTGTMPGPSLWKVTNGDRTLWLLGTVSPLPKNMTWDSAEVEEVVSQADEIIAPGGTKADVGTVDVFKMASLARSAIAATKISGGKELKDVLPEPVYARWAALRTKYMSDNRKVERSRPMFASQDLYFRAISTAGMTQEGVVWNRVVEIAEANDISITQTRIQYPLGIDRRAYKAGIAALAESRIDDQECFARTVD